MIFGTAEFLCIDYYISAAGPRLVHHELLHVHLLGSVLRLPGRLSGQGVCSVRLRIGDPWGEENVALKKQTFRHSWKVWSWSSCFILFLFFSFKGCLTDIHVVKDSWQTCNLSHSPKCFFFCTEGIGFVKLMRFAGYLFLCLSAFPVSLQKSFTSCFTLKQTIDVLFYLFCLINLPWVSEVLRSTWIRKSRNLCSGL